VDSTVPQGQDKSGPLESRKKYEEDAKKKDDEVAKQFIPDVWIGYFYVQGLS